MPGNQRTVAIQRAWHGWEELIMPAEAARPLVGPAARDREAALGPRAEPGWLGRCWETAGGHRAAVQACQGLAAVSVKSGRSFDSGWTWRPPEQCRWSQRTKQANRAWRYPFPEHLRCQTERLRSTDRPSSRPRLTGRVDRLVRRYSSSSEPSFCESLISLAIRATTRDLS